MTKTAWISVGVFAALLILVVATREDKVSVGVRKLEMPTMVAKDVTKVELSHTAGEEARAVVLERGPKGTDEGEGWTVAALDAPGKKYGAEAASVKSVLEQIEALAPDGFVTGRKEKHEDLEIDDKKGLKAKIFAGAIELDLVFGRAGRGGTYMRKSGSDEVFVAKGRLAQVAKKDLKGWRKRKLMSVTADDLREVKIGEVVINAKLSSEEGAKPEWSLTAPKLPEGFRLDEDKPKRIASTLANLRASDFVDEGALGAVRGKVSTQDKDNNKLTFVFGETNDKRQVKAQIEGDSQIYLVSEYSVNTLLGDVDKTPLDGLRSLKLIEFDPKKATKVEFKGPSPLVVEKKDGQWVVASGTANDFVGTQVEPKLAALSRLRASAIASAGYAPGKAPVSVAVTVEGGTVHAVNFGALIPDEKKKEHLVSTSADGLTYVIGEWQRKRYAEPADLFKAPPPPPPNPRGGMPGGMPGGLDQLPPEIRKQLEAQMRAQGLK